MPHKISIFDLMVLPLGRVRIIFKSSQSLVKWAFASLFFALWYYFGTKVSCAICGAEMLALFSTGFLQIQSDGKSCAFSKSTVAGDGTSHKIYQLFHNRQDQTGSLGVVNPAVCFTGKHVVHFCLKFFGHA